MSNFTPNCYFVGYDGVSIYGKTELSYEAFSCIPSLHSFQVQFRTQDVIHLLRADGLGAVVQLFDQPFDYANPPELVILNIARAGFEWIKRDE